MNRARSLAVVALLLSGCIPDTKKLDPMRSAAAACPVLFDLVTVKLGECSGLTPSLTDRYYATAVQSCGVVAAGEKAGRLGYDRALIEGCINALEAPGCDALYGGACEGSPFVPKVAPNGACYNDLECTAASSGCYNPDLTCPGHCLPPGGDGARCSDIDPPCGSSSFCDATTTPATPTCRPRAIAGAACSSTPCVPGQYCALDLITSTYLCKKQLSINTSCAAGYGQCDDTQSLFCDPVTTTCRALPTTPSTVGGACGYPYQCATSLWCDYSPASPVCRAKVANLQPCTSGAACATPGASCVRDSVGGTTSSCRLLLTDGATCTLGLNACQRGLYCKQGASSTTGACVPWPGLLGTCGSISGESVSCAKGWCSTPASPPSAPSTCQPMAAVGQPCPTYNECAGDGFGFERTRCMNVPGQGRICVAPCAAP
jgi:hypothetical protein